MSLPGLRLLADSLRFQEMRQKVLSHNLANVETDGFKATHLRALQMVAGRAPAASEMLDLSQGSLRETGSSLDLALEGNGFFVLDTPRGERLARAGRFQRSPEGVLVDARGNTVQGEKGPIPLPEGEVSVNVDGSVYVDGQQVERLRIVRAPADQLTPEDAGQWRASEGSLRTADSVRVRQGMVEAANSDPLTLMVDMIQTQRAFSNAQSGIRAFDEVHQIISNRLGRVG